MRGIHEDVVPAFSRVWFIPARAGNTNRHRQRRFPPAVHPRTCGEYWAALSGVNISNGSSPHVRGIHNSIGSGRRGVRFIPARAGNTAALVEDIRITAVHPRTCGEYAAAAVMLITNFGSSPHVRGILHTAAAAQSDTRFIPARAGNTGCMKPRCRAAPVHPRTCGEYAMGMLAVCVCAGSSPHVRGIHLYAVERQRHDRFIPARAGNTPTGIAVVPKFAVHPRTCGEYMMSCAFGIA